MKCQQMMQSVKIIQVGADSCFNIGLESKDSYVSFHIITMNGISLVLRVFSRLVYSVNHGIDMNTLLFIN